MAEKASPGNTETESRGPDCLQAHFTMPPTVTIPKLIELETAEELLDALSLRGEYLKVRLAPRQWLFRGQGQNWPLLPTALRKSIPLMTQPMKWQESGDWTNEQQIDAEITTLSGFFWLADANGLQVPEEGLRDYLDEFQHTLKPNRPSRFYAEWPPRKVLSIMALAQHFGLPTRLLDWTYHPLVAAYFAAVGALRQPSIKQDPKLFVWALSRAAHTVENLFRGSFVPDPSVEIVTAAASANENLRAQQGVFTLARQKSTDLKQQVARTPLDVLVATAWPLVSLNPTFPVLHAFTLPVSEASRLLWMLAREGISAGSVYPSFTGVVAALKERGQWAQ